MASAKDDSQSRTDPRSTNDRDEDAGTIVGFDHVQLVIPVGEEDTARQFWVELMDFDEVPKPVELAGRGGAWFQAGPVQIHVGADPDFVPAGRAHPAIAIRNLRAFVAERGLDVEWTTDVPSLVRCQIYDPFGNRVELIEAANSA